MGRLYLFILPIFILACQTSPIRRNDIQQLTSNSACGQLLDEAPWDKEVELLRLTQNLYRAGCFSESLQLGRLLREKLRDKDYSITAEALSVLGPEELSQTYVLESHERVYLTLLLVLNHLSLEDKSAARVELRRASDELDATLYNHGRDDVSTVLIASLWRELDEENMAEPFWRRLGLEQFAADDSASWRIYSVGELEAYDWSFTGKTRDGIYSIKPRTELPDKCVSKTGVLIPIHDWAEKLELRHHGDYHPLLNLKSFVRLPIGFGYGMALGGAGLTIAVGGCALASQSSSGGGEACGQAVKAGAFIASYAPNVFNYAVQPDLRHWPKSPLAFLVTRAHSLADETCSTSLPHVSIR